MIAALLKKTSTLFSSVSDTPTLDAEILLSHVLKVDRSYLYTWPEKNILPEEEKQFFRLAEKRCQAEPIAYLIGHREFWSMDFTVTPAVLIPRPETECVVEFILQKIPGKQAFLADLGTGSGVIALSLAKEKPHWEIFATDISEEALTIAKKNAAHLGLTHVKFFSGDWCDALPNQKFDCIVSNPPYIAEKDPHYDKKNLRFEPALALFSEEDGYRDLKKIITQAKHYLKEGGQLFLEHGFSQAEKINSFLHDSGYTQIEHYRDLSDQVRVTTAQFFS